MLRRGTSRTIRLALLVMGLLLIIKGAWIPLKAEVAQVLLKQAWLQTQQDGLPQKPWPWADHWPVGRLLVPSQEVDQIVLAGDSGHVLAFAPGQNIRASSPGEAGTSMISGHRDTHFGFLKYIKVGELVEVVTAKGLARYRVTGTQIVDSSVAGIQPQADRDELLLVTCYPFNSPLAGGPLRYVVETQRI